MTIAERLSYARWLRDLSKRASLSRDDRCRCDQLAGELEHEGLEEAVDQHRARP